MKLVSRCSSKLQIPVRHIIKQNLQRLSKNSTKPMRHYCGSGAQQNKNTDVRKLCLAFSLPSRGAKPVTLRKGNHGLYDLLNLDNCIGARGDVASKVDEVGEEPEKEEPRDSGFSTP